MVTPVRIVGSEFAGRKCGEARTPGRYRALEARLSGIDSATAASSLSPGSWRAATSALGFNGGYRDGLAGAVVVCGPVGM